MKLWAHQVAALKAIKPAFGLFMEEGTGKTLVYLECIKRFKLDQLLVVCPASLYYMWDEIAQSDDRITVITYDRVRRRLGTLVAQFSSVGRKGILLDEGSKIRRRSGRTLAMCKLSQKVGWDLRLVGTGTPISNGYGSEMFWYAKFLFGLDSPYGTSYHNFMSEYFDQEENPITGQPLPYYSPRRDTLSRIKQQMKGWTFRVTKEECFDLPPKVYEKYIVRDLKGKALSLYKTLLKEGVAMMGDRVVDAQGVMARMHKLSQLTAGCLIVGEKPEPYLVDLIKGFSVDELDAPKLEWLEDRLPILLAQDGGIVVVCNYQQEVRKVTNLCKNLFNETQVFDREFDPKSKFKLVVGHSSPMAFGHNWQHVRHIIFMSNPWSYEVRRQLENRAHRPGQRSKVTIYDVLVRHSIDITIHRGLEGHRDVSLKLLQGLRG